MRIAPKTYYYKFEKVRIKSLDLIAQDFSGWGEVYKLEKTGSLNYLGIKIDLPEKLYAPSSMIE